MNITKEEIENCFTELHDEYQEFGLHIFVSQATTVTKINSIGQECNIFRIEQPIETYISQSSKVKSNIKSNVLTKGLVYEQFNVLIKVNLQNLTDKFTGDFNCPTRYKNKLEAELKLISDVEYCLVRLPEFNLYAISKSRDISFSIKYSRKIEIDELNVMFDKYHKDVMIKSDIL